MKSGGLLLVVVALLVLYLVATGTVKRWGASLTASPTGSNTGPASSTTADPSTVALQTALQALAPSQQPVPLVPSSPFNPAARIPWGGADGYGPMIQANGVPVYV